MHALKTPSLLFIMFFLAGVNFHCTSQVTEAYPEKDKITLVAKVNMPDVKGRIDHMAYDRVNHLAFIAALGNNSVEIVNLDTKTIAHTIVGLREPQGIVFVSPLNMLVVANGDDGRCVFIDAATYKQIGTVNLKNDADNVRYDTGSLRLYAGYGSGGISVIDAKSLKQIGDIALDGHPESFQISKKLARLYINVPDANEIEVADLASNKIIAKWKNTNASSNFPMVLDEDHNRLFVGCRSPATLRMISMETGQDICTVRCSGDADDIFYKDSLVFVSAGKGFIDVFRAKDRELVQINHVETRKGARTSLLVASERKLLVAVPAYEKEPAALWIYNINY